MKQVVICLLALAAMAGGANAAERALVRDAVLCDRLEIFKRGMEVRAGRDYLAKPRYPKPDCIDLPAGARVAAPSETRRLAVSGVREAFAEDYHLVSYDGRALWVAARDLSE